jgi:arylsulfatase A-like enzyme
MAREDLEAKYQQKKEELGLEEQWGVEGERKVRLVQCHPVYAGMVEAMDQAVGKVLDKLEELGLAENTIIFFMSDNGGLSTSEGHPTSNLPLRAGKGWLYEGGIREPWIVRWPGVTTPGSTTDVPVISTDFYPTILEMAGLPLQKEQHQDGVSFVPVLKQEGSFERGTMYWHYPHYGNQGGNPGSAIREGPWKLIHWYEDNRTELYDLSKDVEEKNNLAASEPARVQELQEKLDAWLESVNARMPSPNPAHEEQSKNTAG